MNATVARIVELMFEDTVMNEEVSALKDEIMNNCQDRFEDLTARGMDEDEAIAAVVDSLKGMEEVIAQHPRKARAEDAEDENADEQEEEDLTFDIADVEKIRINMQSDEVYVEPSVDEKIHVIFNKEEMKGLVTTCSGGVLDIYRQGKSKKHVYTDVEQKGFRYDENKPLMENISSILKNLSDSIVRMDIRIGSSQLLVQVPAKHRAVYDVCTTSGDVELRDIAATGVTVNTTSGDAKLDLLPGTHTATLKTTSGDVRAKGNAYATSINTISGDVRFEGTAAQLTINTVSGDEDAHSVPAGAMVKTVSGDMELRMANGAMGAVNLHTTSGDATVRLPDALVGKARVQFSTVSGDKSIRCEEAAGDALLIINARSVSGDLTVM